MSREDKIALYFELVEDEHKRREEPQDVSRFAAYINDPVGFINNVVGEHAWSKQREICEAVRDHDRVAVKSCHSSGKSHVTARVAGWWLSAHPAGEAFVVTTAPTFTQVRSILWREINRVHTKGDLPGYTNQTEWFINGEMVALGRKPDDNAPTAFQGLHARYMLVLIDESCGVSSNIITAAETLVANEGGRMLAIGNPDDPNTEFGRMFKPGSGWHNITISAFDTPNLTGEEVPDDVRTRLIGRTWVEQRKKKWGEDSPLYQSKVLGEFPDVSDDTLIPLNWITAAVARDIEPDGPNELGVDVARYGRNESAIYHRHGSRARLIAATRKRDLMHLCGLIIQAVITTGATVIKIDDGGMGGGVTDRLNEIKRESPDNPLRNCTIVPVNAGWSATDRVVERLGQREITAKERYANLKAEITWQLRDRFQSGDIDLDGDEDTQVQASTIKYEITSRGLMAIESKEDLEKRLNKMEGATGQSGSPDRFDALVLAFADVPLMHGMHISDDILVRATARGLITSSGAASSLVRPAMSSTSLHIGDDVLRRATTKLNPR